ncbi:MAG: radical SAM protein [Euryarchaeota archaeon]|nr:radical SAM protein [Euryarchaeota archaeon]
MDKLVNRKFRKSKLLLKVELENGKKAVFSNTTGSIAVMDSEVETILDSFENPAYLKEVCKNDPLCEKAVNELLKKGILVEEETDEYERLKSEINKLRSLEERYSFTFVLTTRCNFNCVYCYEDKTPLDMMWKTAKKCIDFIEDRVKETGQKDVKIRLYGGEPLLKFDLIKRILNTTRKRLPSIEITTSIGTNGSLLTEEKISFLKKYECKYIQTNIDGIKSIHDSRRPYKNGDSSFDDVINGLRIALDSSVRVGLRINIDKNNVDEVPEFLEYLKLNNINSPNMGVLFERIFIVTEKCGPYKKHCIPPYKWGKEYIKLSKLAQKLGFRCHISLPPRFLYCTAYIKSNVKFNPDGNLISCWGAAGNCPEEFIVGNVFNDPVYNSNADKFFKRSPLDFEECRNCDIVAFCGGGCIASAYTENGTLNSVYCPYQKYNFKELAKFYVKECFADEKIYERVDFDRLL